MPTPENKVKFGLKKVHISVITKGTDQSTGATTYTYGTPHRMPGAVSLSLNVEGAQTPFYADDRAYYTTYKNNGYTGDVTMARIDDWFRTNVLNETAVAGATEGTVAGYTESAASVPKSFAMLFEIQGDAQKRRYVLYDCTVNRPNLSANTVAGDITPDTSVMTIAARPRETEDELVQGWAGPDNTEYANWFSAVWVPSA